MYIIIIQFAERERERAFIVNVIPRRISACVRCSSPPYPPLPPPALCDIYLTSARGLEIEFCARRRNRVFRFTHVARASLCGAAAGRRRRRPCPLSIRRPAAARGGGRRGGCRRHQAFILPAPEVV